MAVFARRVKVKANPTFDCDIVRNGSPLKLHFLKNVFVEHDPSPAEKILQESCWNLDIVSAARGACDFFSKQSAGQLSFVLAVLPHQPLHRWFGL